MLKKTSPSRLVIPLLTLLTIVATASVGELPSALADTPFSVPPGWMLLTGGMHIISAGNNRYVAEEDTTGNQLRARTTTNPGSYETFALLLEMGRGSSPPIYAIEAMQNLRYVSAQLANECDPHPDGYCGTLVADRGTINAWEKFRINPPLPYPLPSGHFAVNGVTIQADSNNLYVSAQLANECNPDTDSYCGTLRASRDSASTDPS